MEPENEKYKRILKILKESKPELDSTEEIEKEVIRRISVVKKPKHLLSDLTEFLFGWIYINWVRRSLIAASLLLVMLFVWQNSIILSQNNILIRHIMVTEGEPVNTSSRKVEKLLMLYKNSSRGFSSGNITISDKQLNQLIESIDELKSQYKDLKSLIEDNPELKKYIEDKLTEINNSKIKL